MLTSSMFSSRCPCGVSRLIIFIVSVLDEWDPICQSYTVKPQSGENHCQKTHLLPQPIAHDFHICLTLEGKLKL